MDHNLFETVEQQAIELVSSLGKEHLFVANCPSDIDADKYSGTVITYEEAFDHSDAGRRPLPSAAQSFCPSEVC